MYDARDRISEPSQIAFGIITILVVGIAFFGVLNWPSGDKVGTRPVAETSAPTSQLASLLDDPVTDAYLTQLNRVSPQSAVQLENVAAEAIATGADKDEIALLVLDSLSGEMASHAKSLAKADVRHFDAMLDISEQGLRSLSQSRSEWCTGAHYESYAGKSPTQMERSIRNVFSYGSPAYEWGLKVNLIALEAIEDAKANPRNYGRMTPADEMALQTLAMRMLTNPQVMQLMTLQGASQAEQMRAVRNLDVCSLAVTGIDALQSLPQDTRARLWVEAFHEMNNGGLERAMQMGQMGGF